VPLVPPSLSRKGGGNAVALLCPNGKLSSAYTLDDACMSERYRGDERVSIRPSLHIRLSHASCVCVESKEDEPLFVWLGQGSPSFLVSSTPFEGDGAPPRRTAWDRQTGNGTACGRALGVNRHAPRLAARQRGIFGLRLDQRSGRPRSCLSLEGFSRGRPWARSTSLPARRLPLPVPALRTPPEGAPRSWNGISYT
jgi:hypothetical protein